MIDSGTPFDRLFADLSDRMHPVLHTTDGEPSQRRRVVWSTNGDPTPKFGGWRALGEQRIGRLAHPMTATVYGTDHTDCAQMLGEMLGWMYKLLGPRQGGPALPDDGTGAVRECMGWDAAQGKGGVRGGNGTAAQYALDVSVTLHTPLRSEYRPLATITDVTISVETPTTGTTEVAVSNP